MGMILSGASELFKGLQELKQSIKDKRSLGYLCFELANLEDFESVKSRIKILQDKRSNLLGKFSALNTKPTPPSLEIEIFINILEEIINNCRDMEKYDNGIRGRKINYNAQIWNLPASKNLFPLFRFYMKQTAEECIAPAGEGT